MRRRPGIQGLQRDTQARGHYKSLGEQVQQTRLEHVKSQLATLKKSLEEFAVKHRQDIRKDAVFRAQFHTMCANAGVDPLASNKGMWAQLLGFGDFYYELGVQIIEACLATRAHNGGLVELSVLTGLVQRRRGQAADAVTEDDILRAIKQIESLRGGYSVTRIGNRTIVRSVPGELSTDTNELLKLAQGKGHVSVAQITVDLRWDAARADQAISTLLKEGFAMLDDGAPGGVRLIWFPCL
jgi:ESCRT-II complex subunit VPS22